MFFAHDVKPFLENNYYRIKSSIVDAVIITVGNQDNFGANIPVMQVEELVKREKMEIKVVMVAGDHFTIDRGAQEEIIYQLL